VNECVKVCRVFSPALVNIIIHPRLLASTSCSEMKCWPVLSCKPKVRSVNNIIKDSLAIIKMKHYGKSRVWRETVKLIEFGGKLIESHI
jgi:hypothetical protein